MKVIYRNFIKLLSIGAFNAEEVIEPMSEFKWKQLLKLSEFNDVSDFILLGIERVSKTNPGIIPDFFVTYSNNVFLQHGRESGDMFGTNDITHHSKSHKFSSAYLNARFDRIIFNEIHSIDTSIDTLRFLDLSIDNVRNILSSDLNLRKIIELGFCLRQNGDRIDFIKAESWFKRLQLVDIMNLIACYLICLLGFEEKEIPFFRKMVKNAKSNIYSFFDGNMRFIGTEVDGLKEKPARQSPLQDKIRLKYLSYFPTEVSSRFFSNIIKRVSDIEE